VKGAIKREPGDNLTRLNQEQTALLLHYLQNSRIVLKDEYLNNTQAGEALSMLTGYSANAMRQNLNKEEIKRLATKKNLTDLKNALISLNILVDNDLKGKK
jgi:hypothetical protein